MEQKKELKVEKGSLVAKIFKHQLKSKSKKTLT